MSSTKQSHILVKAYYNDLQEVLPENHTSSDQDAYQIWEGTISQLSPNYSKGQFVLQYADKDNDRITFSFNNKLQSALNRIAPGGLIRIYLKPNSKQYRAEEIHPVVT